MRMRERVVRVAVMVLINVIVGRAWDRWGRR
jgi:hypothetical protein